MKVVHAGSTLNCSTDITSTFHLSSLCYLHLEQRSHDAHCGTASDAGLGEVYSNNPAQAPSVRMVHYVLRRREYEFVVK